MMEYYNLLAVGIALVGATIFVSYPAPPLSKRLQEWKTQGDFFIWKQFSVFYKDIHGSGQAGTVVCLHGFPTSSFDWIKILPDLKKFYSRIIMLDFLGYGFSDKPTHITYTIGEQSDIVEALVKELEIASTHVLSHDYGDTVALELLARDNSHCLGFDLETLVMLNGGIFPNTHHPRPVQKLLLNPYLGRVASFLYNFHFFSRGFGAVFGSNQPSKEDFQDFWAALRYNDGDRASYKIINFLRERQAFEKRWVGALRSTDLKVLMIYGPADPVNPPAFADYFRKTVPSQSIVSLEPSVGHYPQWEDPKAVSQAIHHFLTSLNQLE